MCCGSVNKQYIKHFNGLKFTAIALSFTKLNIAMHSHAVNLWAVHVWIRIFTLTFCLPVGFFNVCIKPLHLSSDSLYIIIIILPQPFDWRYTLWFYSDVFTFVNVFVLIKRFHVKFNRVIVSAWLSVCLYHSLFIFRSSHSYHSPFCFYISLTILCLFG